MRMRIQGYPLLLVGEYRYEIGQEFQNRACSCSIYIYAPDDPYELLGYDACKSNMVTVNMTPYAIVSRLCWRADTYHCSQASIPHASWFDNTWQYIQSRKAKGAQRLVHYEHQDTIDEGLACAYTPPDPETLDLLHMTLQGQKSPLTTGELLRLILEICGMETLIDDWLDAQSILQDIGNTMHWMTRDVLPPDLMKISSSPHAADEFDEDFIQAYFRHHGAQFIDHLTVLPLEGFPLLPWADGWKVPDLGGAWQFGSAPQQCFTCLKPDPRLPAGWGGFANLSPFVDSTFVPTTDPAAWCAPRWMPYFFHRGVKVGLAG
eukprot:scaffold1201_cov413-Prasinococcus_capsulatus_cf.AAC.15